MSFFKKILLAGGACILGCICIVGLVFAFDWLFDCFPKEEQALGVYLNDNYCIDVFDCTPAEFVEGKYSAHEELKDLVFDAKVVDGFLLLEYTKAQAKMWSESRFLNTFPEISDVPEIELSEDRGTITVYIDPEGPSDDITILVNKVLSKVDLWRTFCGVPLEENITTIVEINRETGEVISSKEYYLGPPIED
jgi:hypothetical protein